MSVRSAAQECGRELNSAAARGEPNLTGKAAHVSASFDTYPEGNAAVAEIDFVRVRRCGVQVARRHVEDPLTVAVAEGSIRDINAVGHFIHVTNQTAHRAQHGQ